MSSSFKLWQLSSLNCQMKRQSEFHPPISWGDRCVAGRHLRTATSDRRAIAPVVLERVLCHRASSSELYERSQCEIAICHCDR